MICIQYDDKTNLAMEKNSVSIHFVRSALKPIITQDIDINDILNNCGIDLSVLDNPDSRVSAAQFGQLWLSVAHCLNDEFFGQDTHRMKVGSFAMLCKTLIHCKTLKNAFVVMLRFFNLLLDDFYSELVVDGQYSKIQISYKNQLSPQQSVAVFGYETLLMLQHGIACWLVSRRIPVLMAEFAYPEPSYSAEYQLMYSSELQFDQPFTALSFETSDLQLPILQNEQTVNDFIRQAPTNIVLKYKNHSSFSASIRKILRATPMAAWPDFDGFAVSFNMTRSTLRRRLSEEGQPFQTIKDQLRRDFAMNLLKQTDQNLVDIALQLGFAEPSAFHRAFKKWTGHTPHAYRAKLR